jgi:hypothetical protein
LLSAIRRLLAEEGRPGQPSIGEMSASNGKPRRISTVNAIFRSGAQPIGVGANA